MKQRILTCTLSLFTSFYELFSISGINNKSFKSHVTSPHTWAGYVLRMWRNSLVAQQFISARLRPITRNCTGVTLVTSFMVLSRFWSIIILRAWKCRGVKLKYLRWCVNYLIFIVVGRCWNVKVNSLWVVGMTATSAAGMKRKTCVTHT